MCFGRQQILGVAVVQYRVVKGADPAGGVVVIQGLHEGGHIKPQFLRQLRQRIGPGAGKHGRHEAACGLGVDDRITHLPWLLRHQAAPDGIALGPEIFAFVVKAAALPVDHHAQRDAVDAGADTAVIERCAGVNGHHVRLGGVADHVGAGLHEFFEQHAPVEAGATNGEIVRGPFTTLVLSPGLAQPLPVGLKSAGGQHAGGGRDALVADIGGDKMAILEFQPVHRRVVAHLHTQFFGTEVVGVDERLPTAHEKRVGAAQVQRARQGRLKVHAVTAHPVAAVARRPDGEAGQGLVGLAAGDFEQVLPELFFRVGLGQHVLRGIVHAAQVARVRRIAAPPLARRGFQQQHAGPRLTRHQRGAQGGIATPNHQNIYHLLGPLLV